MDYTIEPARRADMKTVKMYLKRARLDVSDVRRKKFLLAKNGDDFVGCVQLKTYPGVRELASMLVRKRYREHGVGQSLVRQIRSQTTPPVYLICPQHRQSYYAQFGFQTVTGYDKLPFLFLLKAGVAKFIVGPRLKVTLIAMRWDGSGCE